MKVALISCSKAKQDYSCKAEEMYSKYVLFKKTYNYCFERYDCIVILSAKYGVLFPSEVINPYNLTLNDFSSKKKKEWAKNCYESIQKKFDLTSTFDFFTGINYYKELSKFLPNSKNILKGLGIGQRLSYLNRYL